MAEEEGKIRQTLNIIPSVSVKVAVMSKVQTTKTESSAKTRRPKSTETQFTAKKKRKQWLEVKYVKLKPPPQKKEKPKVQQNQNPQPPKDAQDFSSNWKTLQEVRSILTSFHSITLYLFLLP